MYYIFGQDEINAFCYGLKRAIFVGRVAGYSVAAAR